MTFKTVAIWAVVIATCVLPVWVAAGSPLLQYRQPVYILAGFAGVLGLVCLLVQPLLIVQALPNLHGPRARQLHRVVGLVTLLAVIIHVAGLWITSPPDVVDALLLRSATPFSIYGVLAMWAVFLTAFVAVLRKRLRLSPRVWRVFHGAMACLIIVTTTVHAWMIDGAMGILSKAGMLCAVCLAGGYVLVIDKRTRIFR